MNLKDMLPGERRQTRTATCGREVCGMRTSLETETGLGVARSWEGRFPLG